MTRRQLHLLKAALVTVFLIGIKWGCPRVGYADTGCVALVSATESELMDDIAYFSLTLKQNGRFAGTIMVAGDRDVPFIGYLLSNRNQEIPWGTCE